MWSTTIKVRYTAIAPRPPIAGPWPTGGTLALLVMLVMALGRAREKKGQNLRSLVSAA
ncbi:MAG: hypothetical protein ACPLPT_05620 [Moorellales bacterium]